MCSPYAGDSRSRSTSRSYASGRSSAKYASTSCGVGGNPVKSNDARRINVVSSASADGSSPSCSSRAATNVSIGFRAHSVS